MLHLILAFVAARTLTHLKGKGEDGRVSGADFSQAASLASYELLVTLGVVHDTFECPLV